MENFEKCTVAMVGGPCSQHVMGNMSQLNQPQSAININTKCHPFHKIKLCQSEGKSTHHLQNLIRFTGTRDASAFQFSSQSPENAQKSQISPVSLSLNYAKMRKICTPWPKSNNSLRWSGSIGISYFSQICMQKFLQVEGKADGLTVSESVCHLCKTVLARWMDWQMFDSQVDG